MKRQRFTGFFVRRWRAEVDLRVLFWRDLLIVGSLINLFASFIALALVSQDVAIGTAVAVHFAPLPYNGFLWAAVLRSPQRSPALTLAASIWLVVMALA